MLERNSTPADLAYRLRCSMLGDPAGAGEAERSERLSDGPAMDRLAGFVVHDRRNEVRGKEHARGAPMPPRPWTAIYGATVHQTGSGRLDADHPGILSIPAHTIIHGDAAITLLHPLVLRMEHAHALNGSTMGVEVDVRADGIEGDADTFWRSKTEIDGWKRDKLGRKTKFVGIKTREALRREATPRQLESLDAVLLYMWEAWVRNVPEAQRPHWGVYTHRQGRKSRAWDPGSRIAQRCEALRKAIGWKDVSREHYGSGKAWHPTWYGTADGSPRR